MVARHVCTKVPNKENRLGNGYHLGALGSLLSEIKYFLVYEIMTMTYGNYKGYFFVG